MKEFYFCIDVGGTDIKGGIVGKDYSVGFKDKIKTLKSPNGAYLANSILSIIRKLENLSGLKINDALGLGIAFPGLVDSKTGVLKFIPSLGIAEYNIINALKKSISIPIKIANDAELALIAEHTLGSGKGYSNFAMLTLGTGIGSGLVVNGKPLRSLCPYSSEIGHNLCGKTEFEKVASTKALIKQTATAMHNNPSSKMWQTYSPQTVTGETVFEFKDVDEAAKQVFETFVINLGTQIVNLYNIFTPEIIIIGGGISAQGEKLTKPLEEFVNKNIFLKVINQKVKIAPAKFLNSAGIVGARCLFK